METVACWRTRFCCSKKRYEIQTQICQTSFLELQNKQRHILKQTYRFASNPQLTLVGKFSRYASSFIIFKLYLTYRAHWVSVFVASCTVPLFPKEHHCVTNSILYCRIIVLRRGGGKAAETFGSNFGTELHFDVAIMGRYWSQMNTKCLVRTPM
jgi:hypothetical protein